MKRLVILLIALILAGAAHAALSPNERRIADQQIAEFEANRARLEELENAQRQFEDLGLEAGAIRRAADRIQQLVDATKEAERRLANDADLRAQDARDQFIEGAQDQLLDQALGAAGEIKIVGDILDAKDRIDQIQTVAEGNLVDLLPFIGFLQFIGDSGQAFGQALRDAKKLEELGRQAADAGVKVGKLKEQAAELQERADAFKAQVDAAKDELARLRELREIADFARLLRDGDNGPASVPAVPRVYPDATVTGTNAIGGGTLTPDQMRIATMPSPTQMPAPTPPPMVTPPAPTPPAPTPPPTMMPPPMMDTGMTPFFTGTGTLLLLGMPAGGQIPLIDPVSGTLTQTIGAVTAGMKTNVIASTDRQAANFPFTATNNSVVTIEAFGPGTPQAQGMGTKIPVTSLKIGGQVITTGNPDLFFPTN
jgi:hypothetical protein